MHQKGGLNLSRVIERCSDEGIPGAVLTRHHNLTTPKKWFRWMRLLNEGIEGMDIMAANLRIWRR